MSAAVATIYAERAREFRRMVALSAGMHVALSVAAVISLPSFFAHELPAGPAITMISPDELDARMGNVAPPRPKPPVAEPRPEPVVAPEPLPPEPELTVIPEDPTQRVKKPEPKPAREEPREPAPRPRPQEVEQVDIEDVLFDARLEAGAMPGEAKPEATPQVIPGAGGTGAPLTAEVAAWHLKMRAHVGRTLNLPPGFRGKSLKTRVTLTLTASGSLLGFEVEESSGNPWYDDQIERYLTDQSSFPAPPDSGDWAFIFDGDLR